MEYNSAQLADDFEKVMKVVEAYRGRVDRTRLVGLDEYERRVKAVQDALAKEGFKIGFVFCDEHYCGDVPYLGGNTNLSIEQVAGVIGPTGFHIVAGLEGGYVAEQLAPRAGAKVHKVQMLQLADEEYPIDAERMEDVLAEAAGLPLAKIGKIALLTPRQVIPAALVEYFEKLFGKASVVDKQVLYQKIKNLKSGIEMKLIEDACIIASAAMRAMLAVLKPGMLETEVAAWGYFVARMLGSELDGFRIILGANEANRTLIGLALNRRINEGDWVHLGCAPRRDGYNSCLRRSVIAVQDPKDVTPDQQFWFDFIADAYKVGLDAYLKICAENLPAKVQEQALVDFFASRSEAVSEKIGKKIMLEKFKPYTGTHNSGLTECQEFYGAITLNSEKPLAEQVVTMLDVALRGIGNYWNDVVIPNFDYIVVEDTLGKYGRKARVLTELPVHVQHMVGNVNEL